MEFMVHISNNFPVDGDKALLAQLTKDEAKRAKELADQGILKKLWRRTGRRANVGIWKADDANQLHAALSSLPFFPWLEIEVWPLTEHPNDPNKI
jgi:muconolactone D-isomerase